MTKIRIELNKDGVKALLQSNEVLRDMQRRADNVARAAGPGMKATSWVGFDRAHGRVATNTPEADRAEAEERTLTRAVPFGKA